MVINKGMVGTVDLRRLSDSADSEKKKNSFQGLYYGERASLIWPLFNPLWKQLFGRSFDLRSTHLPSQDVAVLE